MAGRAPSATLGPDIASLARQIGPLWTARDFLKYPLQGKMKVATLFQYVPLFVIFYGFSEKLAFKKSELKKVLTIVLDTQRQKWDHDLDKSHQDPLAFLFIIIITTTTTIEQHY